MGAPPNGWFIKENPIEMDGLGYPYFRKPPCRCEMMSIYWHYISYSFIFQVEPHESFFLQLSWPFFIAESHLLSRTCWELDEVVIPIVLMKPDPTRFTTRPIDMNH